MTTPAENEPDLPATGHDAIDAALQTVADLDRRPLADHPERLARAQAALQAALREPVDDPTGGPGEQLA